MYQELGLNLDVAMESEQNGVCEVLQRMRAGRLKVFRTLGGLLPAIPAAPPGRTRTSSEAERPPDELLEASMCTAGVRFLLVAAGEQEDFR
jgi:hypothetical protein